MTFSLRIVTSKEMLDIEQRAIREFGIPVSALMERAGVAVAQAAADLLGKGAVSKGARVHIVCGKGNNGGDGLVAARSLANQGARVRVFLVDGEEELGPGPATFLRSVKLMDIPVHRVAKEDVKKLEYTLLTADIIVDAMLGTGAKGFLREHCRRAVQAINLAERPVVSVDVPTGVDADSADVMGDAVKADVTVTFGRPKLGLLLDPGCRYTGRVDVVDIGIPHKLFDDDKPRRTWIKRSWARQKLIQRPAAGNKWDFGRVVVVAGSKGMAGAAVLSLQGALRSGAGLVTWMGPAELLDTVQRAVPEATAMVLPLGDGRWTPDTVDRVLGEVREGDVVAIGPGLGRDASLPLAVTTMLEHLSVPVVVDADGLNAMASFAAQDGKIVTRDGPLVLTPHVKEAARLLNWKPEDVQAKRLEALEQLVKLWNGVVLLKGAPTLIQDTLGNVGLNGSGDVSLATGGTGDVLTGLLAGLLAGGHSPWEATGLGAYLHGRAGELAGENKSTYATVATDIANMLPQAFLELKDG